MCSVEKFVRTRPERKFSTSSASNSWRLSGLRQAKKYQEYHFFDRGEKSQLFGAYFIVKTKVSLNKWKVTVDKIYVCLQFLPATKPVSLLLGGRACSAWFNHWQPGLNSTNQSANEFKLCTHGKGVRKGHTQRCFFLLSFFLSSSPFHKKTPLAPRVVIMFRLRGPVRRTLVWFSYLQTNVIELVALVALYL